MNNLFIFTKLKKKKILVFRRKRKFIARLGGIHRAIQNKGNPFLFKFKEKLTREYNVVLLQEELFWFQKARANWLEHGNKNTSFFHTTTKIRRRFNKVEALQNKKGQWVYDQTTLKEMAFSFYETLFKEEGRIQRDYQIQIEFRKLEQRDFDLLKMEVVMEDIKQALFEMGPYKAPGPDEFQPFFF